LTTAKGADTTNHRLILLCGLIPVLIAAGLALWRPATVASLDDAVYDSLVRFAHTKPPGDNVVIVDVDERSLSTIGQWPWRRDLIGQLIRHLRDIYCDGIARSGQPPATADRMGELLEARLRDQVAYIEARGGGTIGTA